MIDFVSTFIFFFAVIDPIGTIPVFIAVTSQYDNTTKRRIAIKATCISAGILIFFIVLGEIILAGIQIPLAAFQIAGGIVLFLFALSMIFGESKPDEEINMIAKENDTAIFPLAVPSIAGPGSMLGAVLMTENSKYSIWLQTQTALVMLSVLLLTMILMLVASLILRVIRNSGASIISRVMGILLSSIAVSNVLEGVKVYFG